MTVVDERAVAPAASITPSVSPGHRLVPAAIGRRLEATQTVWIECPDWCIVDHVSEKEVAVEDISHSSYDALGSENTASATVGSFLSRGIAFELYASLKAEASSNDPRLHRAHIVLDDGGRDDAFLTEDMAEDVADRLVKFAAELRRIARVARQANQLTEL